MPPIKTELKPTHPYIERSGRWFCSPSDTLIAAWCSSSLRFVFSGSSLRIRPGESTRPMSLNSGGTHMIAWTITALGKDDVEPLFGSADMTPLEEVVLLEENAMPDGPPFRVELTLIDWGSLIEIDAIIVDSENSIQPLPLPSTLPVNVLVIGDSISCGYTLFEQHEDDPPFHGYLSAFPSIAQHLLHDSVAIRTVAYPGVSLVKTMDDDGMVEMFFHRSPWSTKPWSFTENPSVVIIALGTNDKARGVSDNLFADTLQHFIERLKALFSSSLRHVCVIDPFPYFPHLGFDQSKSASSVPLLDRFRQRDENGVTRYTFSIAEGMARNLTTDGLHPSPRGHEVLGKNLADKLREILHLSQHPEE